MRAFLLRKKATPRVAEPNKTSDAGSGVDAGSWSRGGAASTKIAALLGVAVQSEFVPPEPSVKNPVIKDPIGRAGSLESKFHEGELLTGVEKLA